jgi:hypothetical protein
MIEKEDLVLSLCNEFFHLCTKKKKEGRVSFCFEHWQTKGGWSVISQTVVDY